jgi:hypothetical protein
MIIRCVAALLACGGLSTAAVAADRSDAQRELIAPGVEYQAFDVPTSHGVAHVHVVTVDLRQPGVRAGLLYPGAVSARQPVAQMADAQDAVAAINGDFFDISDDQHPGVPATGSASGPAMMDGIALKAAVPPGQRYGWTPPPGDTAEVIGVGVDGRARTAALTLHGRIRTPLGTLAVAGLNQYALPQNAIGVFTPQWGTASRARAACGHDDDRSGPCTHNTREVTVHNGLVAEVSDTLMAGPISSGTLDLVGRGAGADRLRKLRVGTPVAVAYWLASTSRVPFTFAVGAHRLLRDHRPLPGLDADQAEPRSAVGIADDGRVLRLVSTDGREEDSTGLTPQELAEVLERLHCDQGVYLDGGGSATLVARDPATGHDTVRNSVEDGRQRSVPNGIAIYSVPFRSPDLPLLPPLPPILDSTTR